MRKLGLGAGKRTRRGGARAQSRLHWPFTSLCVHYISIHLFLFDTRLWSFTPHLYRASQDRQPSLIVRLQIHMGTVML